MLATAISIYCRSAHRTGAKPAGDTCNAESDLHAVWFGERAIAVCLQRHALSHCSHDGPIVKILLAVLEVLLTGEAADGLLSYCWNGGHGHLFYAHILLSKPRPQPPCLSYGVKGDRKSVVEGKSVDLGGR